MLVRCRMSSSIVAGGFGDVYFRPLLGMMVLNKLANMFQCDLFSIPTILPNRFDRTFEPLTPCPTSASDPGLFELLLPRGADAAASVWDCGRPMVVWMVMAETCTKEPFCMGTKVDTVAKP